MLQTVGMLRPVQQEISLSQFTSLHQCTYQQDVRPLQSLLTHLTLWYKSIHNSYQNSQSKSILLKFYFRLIVCKCPYFYKKLRKHCLVQDADISKQNLPTLMASKIAVIWKSDFMDPMNLFPSDAKVTCTCQQDCIYKYV